MRPEISSPPARPTHSGVSQTHDKGVDVLPVRAKVVLGAPWTVVFGRRLPANDILSFKDGGRGGEKLPGAVLGIISAATEHLTFGRHIEGQLWQRHQVDEAGVSTGKPLD